MAVNYGHRINGVDYKNACIADSVVETEDRKFVTPEEKELWNKKAAGTHRHSASDITAGTLSGKVVATMDGNDGQVRNIQISSNPIQPGSALASGTIYIVYEG